MRTLFVGLGGTGGQVLKLLYGMMSEEQRSESGYLYIDLDKNDTDQHTESGIRTIRISTADTVGDLAASLSQDYGVYDWLPHGPQENVFLSSGMDDGASQCRFKSRLCVARFLADDTNELQQALADMNVPGVDMAMIQPRIMVVSSIAGGTGSGSFLDIALYIRKYFRDHGQTARIMGLFACPDLYKNVVKGDGDGTNIASEDRARTIYANAYACIRELNAMNLAVSGKQGISNDYGKSIKMRISYGSGCQLFDSADPKFTSDYNAKPFDLLYFIDESNSQGGEFRSLSDYQQLMADIAYTRLYSALEGSIEKDESNELGPRSQVPTAIFGSVGFAKIVYPYEDILRYIARKKALDDLSDEWSFCEIAWENYKNHQRQAAAVEGRIWTEKPGERGESFLENVDSALGRMPSRVDFLRSMVMTAQGKSRTSEYIQMLKKEIQSKTGIMQADTRRRDAGYGLGKRKDVALIRDLLGTYYLGGGDKNKTSLERLATLSKTIDAGLQDYIDTLIKEIPKQARLLAFAIFPTDDKTGDMSMGTTDAVNLHRSLLMTGGAPGNDVHPVAARYLIYQLQQEIESLTAVRNSVAEDRDYFEKKLNGYRIGLNLFFDEDPTDEEDITIERTVEVLGKKSRKKREQLGEDYRTEYLTEYGQVLERIMNDATEELFYQTMMLVKPVLELLSEQYEGFFDNLASYRNDLAAKVLADEQLHDLASGRYIYVGATAGLKREYYFKARESIGTNQAQIYAIEGSSVYSALSKRSRVRYMDIQKAAMRGEDVRRKAQDDRYDDMGVIFENVVAQYMKILREGASALKMTVVNALITQCCEELHVDTAQITVSGSSARNRFEMELSKLISDLKEKARPMLMYDPYNREKYFDIESKLKLDVSRPYTYLAISEGTRNKLKDVFPTSLDPMQDFVKAGGITNIPIMGEDYNDYELVCCSIVHGLQPTQIVKFNEKSDLSSYYKNYRRQIELVLQTGVYSISPHIDKKWHLRGTMPYISRDLELTWRETVMKAFLAQTLLRDLTYTTDLDSRRFFVIRKNGRNLFVKWPEGKLVLQQNISRLMEYLSEDEIALKEMAHTLDLMIEQQKDRLLNYTTSIGAYKGGMTKNLLLKRLRTDLIAFDALQDEERAAHGKNYKAKKRELDKKEAENLRELQIEISGESEEEIDLPGKVTDSMGGILEIAWFVHKSEEQLGEDRDYGESLLRCAAHVIDQFCQGMYGNDRIEMDNTIQYRNYIQLYNYTMQKFVESYIIDVIRRRKLTKEQLTVREENRDELRPSTGRSGYPDITIFDQIRDTEEFTWISNNWKLKPYSV